MRLMESQQEEEQPLRRRSPIVTSLFLALCVFLYLLNAMEEMQRREGDRGLTPVQEWFLFDPPSFEETPSWQGLYEIFVLKVTGEDTFLAKGPLFSAIREGEIWRFFTPTLLHGNLLHILFNMIWLWILGRPIEERIGPSRLLFMTLLLGCATNIAQYLISGPLFLGFSGVITGWAGFIWMREKIAPWEGYPVPRTTILFLALFIFAMLALQIALFLVQLFVSFVVALNIANTAHIAGFALGALLGRWPLFAWRVR